MIPEKREWIKALQERHGINLQNKISSANVAICGLGGLGSNIAIALARAGIGKLVLIDFDRVDITNLHRQQYRPNQIGMYKTEALEEILSEIAPYTEIVIHTIRMDDENAKEILKDSDIICEAFDDAECKAMLVNFVLDVMPGKYIIAASGMAGIDSANMIHTRKVSKYFYICGDEKNDVSDGIGLVASRVMICAGHQAHMVIRILANELEK